MITEEVYTVYKTKENSVEIKDFDNFEDANNFYRKDLDQYIAGKISRTYKVTEDYFNFDKRKYPPKDQIRDSIDSI